MPSVLAEFPQAPLPEFRALPDNPDLSSKEALQAFSRDLQSPEYVQALLMALSGAAAPPAASSAPSGILQRAKDWLNSIPDDALGRIESASLEHIPGYVDDVQATMARWATKPSPSISSRAALDQAAVDDPIQGVLKALKFSLGRDMPKTAAMAR